MLLPEPEEAAAALVLEAALPIKEDRLPEGGVGADEVVVWLMPPTEGSGAEVVNGEDFVPVDPDSFEVAGAEAAADEKEAEWEGVASTVATGLFEDREGFRISRWDFGAGFDSFLAGNVGDVVKEGAGVAARPSVLPERAAASTEEAFRRKGEASEMTSSPSITGDEAVPKEVLRRIVVALRVAKSFVLELPGSV